MTSDGKVAFNAKNAGSMKYGSVRKVWEIGGSRCSCKYEQESLLLLSATWWVLPPCCSIQVSIHDITKVFNELLQTRGTNELMRWRLFKFAWLLVSSAAYLKHMLNSRPSTSLQSYYLDLWAPPHTASLFMWNQHKFVGITKTILFPTCIRSSSKASMQHQVLYNTAWQIIHIKVSASSFLFHRLYD